MFAETSRNSEKEHTFIMENEQTQETTIVKQLVQVMNYSINLRSILERVGDPTNKVFKIYDFSQNKYCEVKDFNDTQNEYFVPAAFIGSEIILIKYSKDTAETGSVKSSLRSVSDASSVKKERSKERTISEIIDIVKQWREIHLNLINGRKVNLQEAAAMLGISKKSLDDYYYQLRLGEKYGFDFKNNLHEKVGVLRTYIKDVKPSKKGQSKIPSQKHPKELRIISEFGQANEQRYKPFAEMIPENSAQNQMDEQKNEVNSIKQIEDQFYNDFDYLGDEPADPFLNFSGNFRKNDDYSNQLFF